MTLTERFLKYVSFCTTSDEETNMTPSTPGQMEFAKYLANELKEIGMQESTPITTLSHILIFCAAQQASSPPSVEK